MKAKVYLSRPQYMNSSCVLFTNLNLSVPLTEFTIFGDLHPELRLRIWGVFCESFPGRLLEVEVDKQAAAAANMSGSHCFTQVTRSSSIDHLPLFICRESREEALKVWKPVEFGDYARPVRRITYFNQARDTIYCGEGNCMRTIVFSFNKQAQAGIDIPRVAILCSGQVLAGCCDLAPEDQMGGVDDYELVTGRAFANGCTPMQLLHGIDFDFSGSRFYQSCVGLKEISWIVPTKLIDVKGWRDPSWHRIASLCRERLNYRPREVEASHRGRHRACEFRGRSRQCRHKPVPTFPNSAGCLSTPMPNQARSTKL